MFSCACKPCEPASGDPVNASSDAMLVPALPSSQVTRAELMMGGGWCWRVSGRRGRCQPKKMFFFPSPSGSGSPTARYLKDHLERCKKSGDDEEHGMSLQARGCRQGGAGKGVQARECRQGGSGRQGTSTKYNKLYYVRIFLRSNSVV